MAAQIAAAPLGNQTSSMVASFLIPIMSGAAILTLLILGAAAFVFYLFWDTAIVNFLKGGAAVFLFVIVVGCWLPRA